MKKFPFTYILGISILLLSSCSGDSSENPPMPPTTTVIPAAASLIFPENNTECNEGVIRSTTESTVNFRWEAAENADTYQVNLRDLNTNEVRTLNSISTNLDITLLRGNPYAWSVVSRTNSNSETAESAVSQFYNAGLPITNFAPFPAEVIAPRIGVALVQGDITLEWNATDIDNDISTHMVFLSTENPPSTQVAETTMMNTTINLDIPGIYFWNVTTLDLAGNSATSQTFQFRIN